MALLDFLKNKKARDKSAPGSKEKKPAKKVQKVSVAKEAAVAQEVNVEKRQSGKKDVVGFSYSVVKEPHISEKATNLTENNKYTFKVYSNSNKPEIKKSVEGIYNVNVLGVNIVKSPRKKRRLGKTEGFKKAFTKAIVTLKEGQKIEII